MQALVHAFHSVFTCSGDESPLHPLELLKFEIDAQGCPGDSLGRSLVGSVWITGGWERGAVPPQRRVLDGISVGCAEHKVLLLILPSVTHSRFLCVFKGCCHAVGRERGSVVPACAKSDPSM